MKKEKSLTKPCSNLQMKYEQFIDLISTDWADGFSSSHLGIFSKAASIFNAKFKEANYHLYGCGSFSIWYLNKGCTHGFTMRIEDAGLMFDLEEIKEIETDFYFLPFNTSESKEKIYDIFFLMLISMVKAI